MTRMRCTLMMARKTHPGAKHSLDALCTRYGVDRSARVKHGALLDAQLLAQVYVELMGGRQIGLGLMAEPSATVPFVNAPVRVAIPGRVPRYAEASAEELERHRVFVAKMTDPLWNRIASAALH